MSIRLRLAAAAAAAFLIAAAPYRHVTEYAPYSFVDTIVRLHFDLAGGVVYGNETVVVRPKRPLRSLPFDTHGIVYTNVTVGGSRAAYSLDPAHDRIDVRLGHLVQAGTHLRIGFRYWARPARGIFFVHPDRGYPHLIPEIWSQGEPEDNRRWFPTWDEPNEKTPSELILTVPRGWTAVANGYLRSHLATATAEVWDWDSPLPKSTYLIAFAAGPMASDRSRLRALEVDSYVQPPGEPFNALCFGNTRAMIAFYERVTGVAYPFEKYDQVTAERDVFGGMEDSSVTIVTDLLLHPAIEDVEDSCDLTVSHELAQQWYGDDATMSDWSNLWLNEGFATYYDELWTRERFGEPDFEYVRYQAQQAVFADVKGSQTPIVDYLYGDPISLFGANSHQRPAEVLHMLRTMLGDARFFRAVHEYLVQYRYKNADTRQFFSSIDRALGIDLGWFEDEWFFRASYPHYVVSDRYDARTQTLLLRVDQRNPDGRPFRMPIVVEADAGGTRHRVTAWIDRNRQVVQMRGIAGRPQMVLFDPDDNVLRELTFAKSASDLAYQLRHARHVGDREWALRQLAEVKGTGRAAAARAVQDAAIGDPFWGVRADATGVAAALGDPSAVQDALGDPDVRVRLAAESAAATLTRPSALIVREIETMTNDPNPDMASAALSTLGALNPPGSYDRLVAALSRPSFDDALASGALAGLAAQCTSSALPLIERRTHYGTPELERDAAVTALAQCAVHLKAPQLALPVLRALAEDPLISTRLADTGALGTLHVPAANAVLRQMAASDSQEIVRESAESAIP